MASSHDELWYWDRRPKDERQRQAGAVNAAEFFTYQLGPEVRAVQADQAEPFLVDALFTSGFERESPVVIIDLDDSAATAELLEPGASDLLNEGWQLHGLVKDGVIHLHPDRLDKWTLLHELAHYIAPQAGHGPIWCRIYLELQTSA